MIRVFWIGLIVLTTQTGCISGCGFGLGTEDDEIPQASITDASERVHQILYESLVRQNNDFVTDERTRLTEEDMKSLWTQMKYRDKRKHFITDFKDLLKDTKSNELVHCLEQADSMKTITQTCKWPTSYDVERAQNLMEMELDRLNGAIQYAISHRLNTNVVIKRRKAKRL